MRLLKLVLPFLVLIFPQFIFARESFRTLSIENTNTSTITKTLWLKADAGVTESSEVISTWTDQMGNGYNASPSSGSTLYKTDLLNKHNFNPRIYFNSTRMTIPFDVRPSAISDMEVFVVVKGESSTANTLYGNSSGSGFYRHLASHQIITTGGDVSLTTVGANKTAKQLMNVYYGAMNTSTAASSHAQINDGNLKSFTEGTGAEGISTLHLGYTGQAGAYVGNIYEMIFYDGEVSSTERNITSSYLAIKYATHLNNKDTNDYVNSDGTVIWDASANVGFNNDVVGIGRDDSTTLDQRIAAQNSTDYFNLMVSLDNNFTSLNTDASRTTTHTNNKQYFMLGDNAGTINFTNPVFMPGYVSVSWLYWKVQKSNFTQNVVFKLVNGQAGTHLVKSTSSVFSSNVTDLGAFSSQILTNVSLSNGDYLAIAKVGTDPGIGGFDDETKTYGDPDFTLTAPTSNGTGAFTYFSADTSIASVISSTGVVSINSAGSVVITVQQASDGTYNMATISKTLTILKKGITASSITAEDKVYDGTTSATVDVSGLSFTGIVGSDVVTVTSVGVFDTKNVGTNKTVTLTNTYGGADIGNYTITDQTTTTASITAKTLTVTAIDKSKTYDGTIYSAGYSVTYDSFVSGEGVSNLSGTVTYTGSAITATDVGSYTISPTGYTSSNYNIQYVAGALSISKAGLNITGITAEDKVYDGTTSATIDISGISYTGLASGDSITVTSTAVFDTKNVGTGKTVTLTNTYGGDATNYTITDQTTTTASITAKTLTITAIDKSKTYDGTVYSGGYSVTYTGFVTGENASVLAGTVTYTGAALTATDVGTYSITPDGYISTNYTLLFESGTLSITKAGLTVSGIKANDKAYDGTTSATVDVSGINYTGLASGDSITVNSTGVFDTKNVGTGKTVTLTNTYGGDATNYTLTDQITTTASITTKDLMITAVDVTRVYDGSKYSGFTVNYNSFASGESISDLSGTLSFTGAGVDAIAIGSYSFTAQGLSSTNYNISYVGGSHIIKDPAEIPPGSTIYIIPTASQSKTYGASNPTLTYSTSPTVTLTGTLSRVLGEDIGTYSITLGTVTSSVYTLVLNPEVFTINKKTITTTGIKAADKVYDTTTSATVTTSSVVFVGLVGSDVVTVTSSGVFDNKNVDIGKTVTLTNTYGGADLSKYTVVDQTSTTATITAATMTVTNISAYEKVYDGTKTALLNSSSMSYTGLLAGDTVGITPVGTFVNKHVGSNKMINLSYTFSVTANYQISYQATSTASITPATLSVTTVDATKTYDGSVYSGFTVSFNGFQGTDSVVDLPGALSFTGSGTTATKVGVYSVKATGYTSTNYNIYFIAGTLTINAVPVVTTVRVIPSANQSKTYGETDPVFTYTTEPDTELEGTLSRVAGEAAGTYQFTLGNLSHSSYLLAIDAVDFRIHPKTIVVSGIRAKDKIYDGTTSALVDTSSVVFSGLLPGDSASVVSSGVFEDSNIGTDKTVHLTNTYTLNAASSYLILDQTTTTASITFIPIYVIPDRDQFKVYGDSYPLYSYTTSPSIQLTGVLGREIGSDVGTYSYTLGTLESPLHSELILVSGFFSIIPKDLEIKANSDYFRYDYSNKLYVGGNGVAITGFAYGETKDDLLGLLNYTGSSQGAYQVGVYDIIPGGYTSVNYIISFVKGTLIIDDPDTDEDGIIDSIDDDDDGDGQLDINELACGSDPLDYFSVSPDRDKDHIPDCLDEVDDLFAISGLITPGSSGMESTWKIINIEYYPNHLIQVFNQNKKLVFETRNYQNDWAGSYLKNKSPLPANAYYYMVNLNNGQDPYTGWIYITY